MSKFAKIDDNNIVTNVIVAEQDFIDSGKVGDPSRWIQTSYNTKGGIHYGPDGNPDGGVPLRKNYAGIGFTYSESRDAFIPLQPYAGWILNESTCLWESPVPVPDDEGPYIVEDGKEQSANPTVRYKGYGWDENTQNWVVLAGISLY